MVEFRPAGFGVWFGLVLGSLFLSPPSDCSSLPSTMTWAPCPHGPYSWKKNNKDQNSTFRDVEGNHCTNLEKKKGEDHPDHSFPWAVMRRTWKGVTEPTPEEDRSSKPFISNHTTKLTTRDSRSEEIPCRDVHLARCLQFAMHKFRLSLFVKVLCVWRCFKRLLMCFRVFFVQFSATGYVLAQGQFVWLV